MDHYAWHGWMSGYMWLGFIVAFIALVSVLYLALGRRKDEPGSPRQIIERRYAKGEIDREEYERLKRDLSH